MDRKAFIESRLADIENGENIRIIYAAESGSRAWGFPSPDSDYDVRFIYMRSPEHYLRLDKTPDVISWPLDGVYDINGWDLKKTLVLLHKSNPTIFEWNNSPIVYRNTDVWRKISPEIDSFFISRAGVYHYLHMAKGNYRDFLTGETVKMKKYFYVLRPIFACMYIIKNKAAPPMTFSELMREADPDPIIKSEIESLISKKSEMREGSITLRNDVLNEYILSQFEIIEAATDNLPVKAHKDAWNKLNKIFIQALTAEGGNI